MKLSARNVSIAFIFGVGLAQLVAISEGVFLVLAIMLGLLVVATFVRPRVVVATVFAGVFLFGVARSALDPIRFPFLNPVEMRLEMVRDSFVDNLKRALPEPYASYLAGVLVGVRASIPKDMKNAFRVTGTTHITALSGYNVTIIAGSLSYFSARLPLVLGGIVAFVLATGASSSVIRAAIMGMLLYISRAYGENYDALTALVLAAAVMIMINPTILFSDIGFQLSVMATLGIVLLEVPIARVLWFLPERAGIRDAASSTIAAQATTLPLIMYYFGLFSPLSPIVNVLVLTTMPLMMGLGFIAGIGGYMPWQIARAICAWPAYMLAYYQVSIIELFARMHVF